MTTTNQSPTIIPALYARQQHRGYLTADDMRQVADQLGVPLYRIQSLVSFYPQFRTSPPAKVQVHICRDMSCHLRGSVQQTERLAAWASRKYGDNVEVCGVSCLGRCDRPVATFVNEQLFVARGESEMQQIIEQYMQDQSPVADTDQQWASAGGDGWQMDVYQQVRDYRAVKDYLADPRPERLMDEPGGMLTVAGLLGMGGQALGLTRNGMTFVRPWGHKNLWFATRMNRSPALLRTEKSCCGLPILCWKG